MSSTKVIFFVIFINLKRLNVVFVSGCKISLKTFKLYAKCEQKHSFVMKTMIKWCVWVMLATYGPTSLIPVCYAIFGFPTRDKWQQATVAKYKSVKLHF